jgi:hypothetical protein
MRGWKDGDAVSFLKGPFVWVDLKHGHSARLQSPDPYGLAKKLMPTSAPITTPQHFVGQDGSDIYFRPADVVMVSVVG